MAAPITVGVSLKMYFGHGQAIDWFERVADIASSHPAVLSSSIDLFVIPTYLQILPALNAFAGTLVRIGAQDAAATDSGAFTGEVSAAELAEVGVELVEIGHAERRRLFGETDEIVASKTRAALRNGLTPVLCIGESEHQSETDAAAATIAQLGTALADAPPGRILLAYEPVWAIGAPEPAPAAHIRAVCAALRRALDALPERSGSSVIYGGSAGPGLLTSLSTGDADSIDGLFLGRFAHDPASLTEVLDEAAALTAGRSGVRA